MLSAQVSAALALLTSLLKTAASVSKIGALPVLVRYGFRTTRVFAGGIPTNWISRIFRYEVLTLSAYYQPRALRGAAYGTLPCRRGYVRDVTRTESPNPGCEFPSSPTCSPRLSLVPLVDAVRNEQVFWISGLICAGAW